MRTSLSQNISLALMTVDNYFSVTRIGIEV